MNVIIAQMLLHTASFTHITLKKTKMNGWTDRLAKPSNEHKPNRLCIILPLVPFLGIAVKAALSGTCIVVTAPVGVTVRVIIALSFVGSVAIALLVQTRSTLRHFQTVLD